MRYLECNHIHQDRNQNGGCQRLGRGRGGGELVSNGHRVTFEEEENVLETNSDCCCTTMGIYIMR